MKKIVIILLAVLPIFLIVVISFAGRILSEVSHIVVENVAFVDDTENKYEKDKTIVLNKGETYQLKIKVYPELASNKKVTFTSSDIDICTVDANGLVTAVGNKLATATITVKTEEKEKTARIYINVVNTKVESVQITDSHNNEIEELHMSVGETTNLHAIVEPMTAANKRVKWESSDTSLVYVDNLGNVTARKSGSVKVKVTSIEGNVTDEITVIVGDGAAKLSFDFSKTNDIYIQGAVYCTKINEFKLTDYLVYDVNLVNPENIVIQVNSGPAIFNAETGMLTINEVNSVIYITAKLNDGSGIKVDIRLIWIN